MAGSRRRLSRPVADWGSRSRWWDHCRSREDKDVPAERGRQRFSTNDVQAARAFYGDVLGFDVTEQYGVLNLTFAGGGKAWIYPKDDHEPAKFTVLNIVVDDIEQAVDDLAAKGVTFEHYDDDPIRTDAKGISREGGGAMAWFKDPAGNIVSVGQFPSQS